MSGQFSSHISKSRSPLPNDPQNHGQLAFAVKFINESAVLQAHDRKPGIHGQAWGQVRRTRESKSSAPDEA